MIVQNETINESSIDTLCEYVNLTIEQCDLLYHKDTQKYQIGELMQQVFNNEETSVGMKSLVVVSPFN